MGFFLSFSVGQKRPGYHLLYSAVFGYDLVSVTGILSLGICPTVLIEYSQLLTWLVFNDHELR